MSVRLSAGQLKPGDAGALRAAGFETQAQQCERLGQVQQDQRMADQVAYSRAVHQQDMQRVAEWKEMELLERMIREPLSPDQIAANRRRYGLDE